MRFSVPQNLKNIAEIIGAKYIGDANFPVLGTNEIHRVKAGEIVFVNHPKYYDKALNSEATIILIDKEVACPEGKALLISEDPFRDFNIINAHFTPIQTFRTCGENLTIGENCDIHSSVVIGNDVKIGKNCIIMPNVVIGDRTEIGDNCIIQSGTILGGDAFYYRKTSEGYIKMLSVGNVVLENNVEIGAFSIISLFQYLYDDENGFHFMNNEDFSQIYLNKEMIENAQFMKAGEEITIILKEADETPLSAELPATVFLEVVEADPGVKGNTATNALKNCIVETGARVLVPLFIEPGDKIKVNTEDGSYLERVK